MGMFDTFYGKVKCPYCGKYHDVDYQTKDYDCVMGEFNIGDYIDKANATYDYLIDGYCSGNKTFFDIHVITYKGQIIDYLNNMDFTKVDMDKLRHIPEGLGWRQNYSQQCNIGVGFDNMKYNNTSRISYEDIWKNQPKKIGDKLFALDQNWIITDVYKEIRDTSLDENEHVKCLYDTFYKDNYVYKIINRLGDRIARITKQSIEIMYDKGLKTEYDSDRHNDFFLQYGCKLVKL